MFSLFRGAYGEITRREEFFVAILGLDGAGKTTYLEQVKALFDKHYRVRDLSKITSTVGLNHVRLALKDCVVNCWDLGGERELRSLWRTYLDECQAVVFVVDASDVARLQEVFSALEGILSVERVCRLPLMVLFNKCDLQQEEEGEQRKHAASSSSSSRAVDSPRASSSAATAEERASSECLSVATAIEAPASIAAQRSPRLSNGSIGGGGWQSFELEEDNDVEAEHASSTCASSSCSDSSSANGLMERFRRQYFNNHLATVHQADAAIFSVSALQNTHVKRSVTWLINALSSSSSPLQRH